MISWARLIQPWILPSSSVLAMSLELPNRPLLNDLFDWQTDRCHVAHQFASALLYVLASLFFKFWDEWKVDKCPLSNPDLWSSGVCGSSALTLKAFTALVITKVGQGPKLNLARFFPEGQGDPGRPPGTLVGRMGPNEHLETSPGETLGPGRLGPGSHRNQKKTPQERGAKKMERPKIPQRSLWAKGENPP